MPSGNMATASYNICSVGILSPPLGVGIGSMAPLYTCTNHIAGCLQTPQNYDI